DLGRVIAAGVQRVTAEDSQHASPAAAQQAVLLDRLDHVLAATRLEATVLAEQGTDPELVAPDEQDERTLRQSAHPNEATSGGHGRFNLDFRRSTSLGMRIARSA